MTENSSSDDVQNATSSELPMGDVQTALDTLGHIQAGGDEYLTEDERGVLTEGKQEIERLRDDSPEVFEGMDATAGKAVVHQSDPEMITYGILEYLRDEREDVDDELMNSTHYAVQNATASGFDPLA